MWYFWYGCRRIWSWSLTCSPSTLIRSLWGELSVLTSWSLWNPLETSFPEATWNNRNFWSFLRSPTSLVRISRSRVRSASLLGAKNVKRMPGAPNSLSSPESWRNFTNCVKPRDVATSVRFQPDVNSSVKIKHRRTLNECIPPHDTKGSPIQIWANDLPAPLSQILKPFMEWTRKHRDIVVWSKTGKCGMGLIMMGKGQRVLLWNIDRYPKLGQCLEVEVVMIKRPKDIVMKYYGQLSGTGAMLKWK